MVGQAELASAADRTPTGDIEITFGDAKARPRSDQEGRLRTRARREEELGRGALMAYEGSSSLSAGGEEIEVPEGTGSTVEDGNRPSPPEQLLDPPELVAPPVGGYLGGDGGLRIRLPNGAASGAVEICADAECHRLLQRITGVGENAAAGAVLAVEPEEGLEEGDLFWRATAVSASGLDGYPSQTRSVRFDDQPDLIPPIGSLHFDGRFVRPRPGMHDATILGPGASVQVRAEDQSGIGGIVYRLDDQTVDQSTFSSGWTEGPHSLSAHVRDGAGNVFELEPEPIVVDHLGPVLSWGREGDPSLYESSPSPATDNGASATPFPDVHPRRGTWTDPQSGLTWSVRVDTAQLIARPLTADLELDGWPKSFETFTGIWVLAQDAVCPDTSVAWAFAPSSLASVSREHPSLYVEAEDCVGNRSRVEIPLVPRK